jgi:hypothetical protein
VPEVTKLLLHYLFESQGLNNLGCLCHFCSLPGSALMKPLVCMAAVFSENYHCIQVQDSSHMTRMFFGHPWKWPTKMGDSMPMYRGSAYSYFKCAWLQYLSSIIFLTIWCQCFSAPIFFKTCKKVKPNLPFPFHRRDRRYIIANKPLIGGNDMYGRNY